MFIFARFLFLALVAIAALSTGCAVVSTETTSADGSRTSTRSVEWVPGPAIYVAPVYGYEVYSRGHHDRDRGRDLTKPIAAIRANPSGTCPGMNGQNIGGICYYY